MENALTCLTVVALLSFLPQSEEPVVSTDSLSVHTVRQGNMPLSARAAGVIESVNPPRAIVTTFDERSKPCEARQKASVQIKSGKVFTGIVLRVLPSDGGRSRCELELADSFPPHAAAGEEVHALIDIGELRDVVYFARPADSVADSDAVLFVLEPEGKYARRVSVRYGRLSGPLIQIVSGLSAGDRVIVTDMSKYRGSERVRLQ